VAIATSFPASIVRQALDALDGIGVESPGAIVAPLVRSSVENALSWPTSIEL
jgi:predicted short-subunit dehydrogenase-like oxidoreductase (DUF2520 family)